MREVPGAWYMAVNLSGHQKMGTSAGAILDGDRKAAAGDCQMPPIVGFL